MDLYNLNNSTSLEHDYLHIVSLITDMYDIEFHVEKFYFFPKTKCNSNIYAFGHPKNIELYNLVAPKIKGIHLNMHAFAESLYKQKNVEFNQNKEIVKKYSSFKYFRILNNKFKHGVVPNYEVDFISLVSIIGGINYIDVLCQFKYENNTQNIEAIMFSDFMELFFLLLEDVGFITINRIPFKKNIFNS